MFIISVFAAQQNLIYDANGNLVTGDGKYREYNVFNQLVKVRQGNSSSGKLIEEYIYDPTEERVLVKRDYVNTSNTPQRVVLYVNDNFVREFGNIAGTPLINDTYYAKDDSGTVGETRYNGSWSTTRLIKNRKLYYHNDLKTSVSVLTNDSGAVVEQTFYEPYGKILAGGVKEKYTYENKEYDPHIKTYDFHFRQYQPDWNKFTQPDTVFQNLYDPQLLNRYTIERGNPYKYNDPNGKDALQGGIDFTGGFLWGGSIGGGFAVSRSSVQGYQIGVYYSWGGGGFAGIEGSGNVEATYFPFAETLNDINGKSFDLSTGLYIEEGGSLKTSFPISKGYNFGKSLFHVKSKPNAYGLSYGAGLGGEGAGFYSNTNIIDLWHLDSNLNLNINNVINNNDINLNVKNAVTNSMINTAKSGNQVIWYYNDVTKTYTYRTDNSNPGPNYSTIKK